MSVSTVIYAHRENMIDNNNQIIGGMMNANAVVNESYFNFLGTRFVDLSFVETGQGVWGTISLIKFNNGTELKVDYECYDIVAGRRNLRRNYKLVKGSNVIKTFGIYFNQIEYNTQHSYRPFENVRHTIVDTIYTTNPTLVNDPADYISFPGSLFFPKAAVIDPVLLSGSVKVSDVTRDWHYIGGPNHYDNDADLATFKGEVVAGGDGKNPFTEEDPEPDPDPSEPGGGDRPSTDGGVAVDYPTLPSVNVIATGLLTMYNPSQANLLSLAGVLWGNDFEQSIKKILNDPFDGIIGLSMVPFTPATAGSENCQIGNFDTEVSMPLVSAQWQTIDAGTVQVKESWKNALDYSPNTSVEIFIPFVGFRELKTEDVMNKTISLKYNVDLLTGAAIAMVKCGDKVLYTYPCKLSYDVPLTGSNKAALYTGMINIAMSAIKGASMGGALGAAGGAATSAIQTATSKQSNIDRSGSITSNTGYLGDFVPYIVIHRPVQSMPAHFKQIKGYQSNITALLSDCSGYTEVDYIHLTGISGATDAELNEIESMLKSGVII